MKFEKRILAISLLLMALTTAVFADHVAVDYDHGTNFRQVKTYSWSRVHTANSIWDQRVKDAIDKQLTRKAGLNCHPVEMFRCWQWKRLPFISSTKLFMTVSEGDAGVVVLEMQPPRSTTTKSAR